MSAVIGILVLILQVYSFLIIARVLLTWIHIDPYNPIAQFLIGVTEPVLAPIRRIMPQTGPLDFSPLVALLLIQVIGMILTSLLSSV